MLNVFKLAIANKIEDRDKKYGDFRQYDNLFDFIRHLQAELKELKDAVAVHRSFVNANSRTDKPDIDQLRELSTKVADEAVDVAALAYMIWWNANKRFFT